MKEYKKVLALQAIIFFLSLSTFAQIDSLLGALHTSKPDTNKANLLSSIATSYLTSNPVESLKYCDEGIALNKLLGNNLGLADGYKLKGTAYFYLGKYDSAKHYWKATLDAIPINYTSKKADALNNMGVLYQRIGQNDSSLTYHLEVLEMRQKLSDSTNVAKSLSNIAAIYRATGDYQKAADYYFAAIKIYEKYDLKKEESDALNGIGLIFMGLKKYDKSLFYLEKSLTIRKNINNIRLIASSTNNIAGVYELTKNYNEAERFYQNYLQLVTQLGDKRGLAGAYSNLGNVYKAKEEIHKSISSYEDALALFTEMKDVANISLASLNLGLVYLSLKDVDRSIMYFETALEKAIEISSWEFQKMAYKGLSDAYKLKNDYQKSLDYMSQYAITNDSLFNTSLSSKIAKYQELYESEKKAKEIQILKNEAIVKQKQNELDRIYRNWAIAFFVLALLVLIMLFNRFQLKKRIFIQKEKILENEKEEYRLITEIKEKELDAKNGELSSLATSAVHKNQILDTLSDKIQELKTHSDGSPQTIKELEKLIKTGFNLT